MEFSDKLIYVNGEEKKLPKSELLDDVVAAYWNNPECDTYFVKLNGKTINGLLDETEIKISEGDKIEIFPLVIGG